MLMPPAVKSRIPHHLQEASYSCLWSNLFPVPDSIYTFISNHLFHSCSSLLLLKSLTFQVLTQESSLLLKSPYCSTKEDELFPSLAFWTLVNITHYRLHCCGPNDFLPIFYWPINYFPSNFKFKNVCYVSPFLGTMLLLLLLPLHNFLFRINCDFTSLIRVFTKGFLPDFRCIPASNHQNSYTVYCYNIQSRKHMFLSSKIPHIQYF